jgi:predicted NUDIX family NTP pyrophosphohydrolase
MSGTQIVKGGKQTKITLASSAPGMRAGPNRIDGWCGVAKRSAGLLMYRRKEPGLEVFLVHPGGPFWAKKDLGAWSIPKGEYVENEEPLAAARREFEEETGIAVDGEFVDLGEIRQAGGKLVKAWAIEGDLGADRLVSNLVEMEWPPRSGRKVKFPEVDRGSWFTLPEAREKILASQKPVLERLEHKVR